LPSPLQAFISCLQVLHSIFMVADHLPIWCISYWSILLQHPPCFKVHICIIHDQIQCWRSRG
jgi:hypothetical protein